jgi:hypothetical protein
MGVVASGRSVCSRSQVCSSHQKRRAASSRRSVSVVVVLGQRSSNRIEEGDEQEASNINCCCVAAIIINRIDVLEGRRRNQSSSRRARGTEQSSDQSLYRGRRKEKGEQELVPRQVCHCRPSSTIKNRIEEDDQGEGGAARGDHLYPYGSITIFEG